MRYTEKENLLGLLAMIQEAVEYMIQPGSSNQVQEQLTKDCEAAIGNVISWIEKEDYPLPDLLCRARDIEADLASARRKDLSLVQRIERMRDEISINIGVKLKIAFFPYKYSMWDCMKSVWEAASKDEGCQCCVVPIPYYDLKADGNHVRHYEGREFPMEIVNYQNYDPELERPDIVYVHNPYDNQNIVTSVAPRFYIKNLKSCLNMVVYIPYYVAGYAADSFDDEYLMCHLNGLRAADRIILQSEEMRRYYIENGVDAGKVVSLGNPKIDMVLRRSEEGPISQELSQKIAGRKCILLNTSLLTLLGEKGWLVKIEEIICLICRRSQFFLIWRPHPLMEATIKSMRSGDLAAYNRIKVFVENNPAAAMDQGADFHPSMALADAMISDLGSLLYLFTFTGKPALSLVCSGSIREYARIYCDFFSNYFVEDGTSVDDFLDMLISGRDEKRNERMETARRSVENPDGSCGWKIHQYVKTQVTGEIPPPTEEQSGKQKRVVALAPFDEGWKNVELVKDCGLIPYLLYKEHGCSVTMVGAKGDTYTYLDQYVKGLQMEFLENGMLENKLQYIRRNARQINCLILRGCYPTNFEVTDLYKKLNPEGKVYVGLDANSHWMDRIVWTEPEFMRFMDQCDIIGTSCRALERHLNEKWPWNIELFPNGYYNFEQNDRPVDFKEKSNTIITVGRLGTEQKATNILLESFAEIADKIPEWSLRLIGSVENEFEPYRKQFFLQFPQLRDRITFAGCIQDREKLAEEYRQAKIFALPSLVEGGSPNVVSEALNGGCVTIVTKFDAYEDATDCGKCGLASEINNIQDFADNLLTLCLAPDLCRLSQNAMDHGKRFFDMKKVVKRLHYMIFEEADR